MTGEGFLVTHYCKARSNEILTLRDKAVGYIPFHHSAAGFYHKHGHWQQIRLPSECSEPLFFEHLTKKPRKQHQKNSICFGFSSHSASGYNSFCVIQIWQLVNCMDLHYLSHKFINTCHLRWFHAHADDARIWNLRARTDTSSSKMINN